MGNSSYLSEAWNWLDFIVVVTSLLENLPGMDGVRGLRTFRLFRPLRSMVKLPSMKLLIGTLMSSLSQLSGIMGLALFFFAIFSILGISLLDGKSHWRCYLTAKPDEDGIWELDPADNRLCNNESRKCTNSGSTCGSRYEMYDTDPQKFQSLGWSEKNLS